MPGNGSTSVETADTLTDEELGSLRAYSERYELETADVRAVGPTADGLSPEELGNITDDEIRNMISPEAWDHVVYYEVGGRAAYERKYRKPEWPGAQSGVTIGIGYDIGQAGLEDFTRVWRDRLPPDHFERLAKTAGIVGPAARGLPRDLQDIEVPWETAEEVYRLSTIPRFARLVLRHLAHARELHPHSFGALFSLVFNRGTSFANTGDRYREMRSIRSHMHDKAFDEIAADFRSMKRIWQGQNLPGLLKRRDAEAALFELGLKAPRPAEPMVAAAAPPAAVAPQAAAPEAAEARGVGRALRRAPEADENWLGLERSVERGLEAPPATRGIRYTRDDVSWSPDDRNPEYRHLDTSLADREFSFGPKDLELIIRASSFEPSRENGVILFGLRGAELVAAPTQINRDTIRLRDARPDHRSFRCVIGAYHIGRQQLSAFIASTVPNEGAVHTNWVRHVSNRDPYGNMLMSGCYRYYVGTHGGSVPGAFRLQEDEEVVVLRSNTDVSYDTLDFWDPCVPNDNLHPALRSLSFSSAGCQTVRGTYTSEQGHAGEWRLFREAVGLARSGRGDDGRRFDYVLVTGLEAAIAAKANATPEVANDQAAIEARLARLRYGSKGDRVKALQQALGKPVTGFFGADDKVALAALQKQKLGFADGVHSRDMDAKLGLNVFAAPMEVASAEAETRSLQQPTKRMALVIGNGDYQNAGAADLVNPGNDAKAVAGKLRELGFEVDEFTDRSKAGMSEAIDTFIEKLKIPEGNADAGLFFFAGHGVQIDGENYLLPIDVQPRTESLLTDSSYRLNNLIRQLERTKKAGLIFLDCCRNNPWSATRALGGGLARIDARPGIYIAFSTAPDTVALDGEGTVNSPFTSSLIEHLPDPDISVSQMMIRVRRDVIKKTNEKQVPWESSSLTVDFAFKPTTTAARSLSVEAQEQRNRDAARTQEEDLWKAADQSNSEQLLRSFMNLYPGSKRRDEAAKRLRWLQFKDRFFWLSAATTAIAAVVCLLGVIQWFHLVWMQRDDVDFIGGDVGVELADLKINPYDDTLAWCRLRCVARFLQCSGYSYHRKRCFIKEDLLYMDQGDDAKDSVSSRLWWSRAPQPSPFKMYWDQMFEGGSTIEEDGSPAPVAVLPPAAEARNYGEAYNAWGFPSEQFGLNVKGNPGIVCQKLCYEQPKCVAFTFNTIYARCRLFGSLLKDENGEPKVLKVPHYSQPDPNAKMTLPVPLVISGVRKEQK